MECKFLSQTILAVGAATVSALTAFGEPASAQPQPSFDCQILNGVPTTVANSATGESNHLFYWHGNALGRSENARQKCQQVSGKLQAALVTSGYDNLSIRTEKVGGVPVVCVNEPGQAGCGEVLFSASSPRNMGRILGQQGDRGLHRAGFNLTIWDILGMGGGHRQGPRLRR